MDGGQLPPGVRLLQPELRRRQRLLRVSGRCRAWLLTAPAAAGDAACCGGRRQRLQLRHPPCTSTRCPHSPGSWQARATVQPSKPVGCRGRRRGCALQPEEAVQTPGARPGVRTARRPAGLPPARPNAVTSFPLPCPALPSWQPGVHAAKLPGGLQPVHPRRRRPAARPRRLWRVPGLGCAVPQPAAQRLLLLGRGRLVRRRRRPHRPRRRPSRSCLAAAASAAAATCGCCILSGTREPRLH